MKEQTPAILLVDDKKRNLDRLQERVRQELGELPGAQVAAWDPRGLSGDPEDAFAERIGDDTVLVVTDLDLTPAVPGLLGHSIVAWCRKRFIPVGDFSSKIGALPKESDLFELRVPRGESAAVAFIARMYRGFRDLRAGMENDRTLLGETESPGQLLATLLGRRELESQFSPYMTRPGMFNASLLDTLAELDVDGTDRRAAEKTRLLTYIVGHVFVNAVLRYPGPLLAKGPCCAYLAMSEEDAEEVLGLFGDAGFDGAFADGERLFWRDRVDAAVERLSAEHEVADANYESFGDFRRAVVSRALESAGRTARAHACPRDGCNGIKGGFWCPFTGRPVCERQDCSSTASSWVPSGAYACRVERDYFDERAPILNL